jgi:tetratricopeptide (TPR) repeat protein
MKKIGISIVVLIVFVFANAQDITLSENAKEYQRKKLKAFEYINKVYRNPELLPEALQAFEDVFILSIPERILSALYHNYADLLAQSDNLQKAIQYYDLAFQYKSMTAKEFGYNYRKIYFAKDTTLFNNKFNEYSEKMKDYYTAQEIELLIEVKNIFAIDQFSRTYYQNYKEHLNCSKNIIEYADSITMKSMILLLEKYPDNKDPMAIDFEARFVISRHIFTAYPQFWLTYFEPRARKALIEEFTNPQTYATMYDRCLISTTGGFSYYGEWDNNGKNANPDVELINKRRDNLGLPTLLVNKTEKNIVFPVYTE